MRICIEIEKKTSKLLNSLDIPCKNFIAKGNYTAKICKDDIRLINTRLAVVSEIDRKNIKRFNYELAS